MHIAQFCLQLHLFFFSVNSIEPNVSLDQPALMPYNQGQGGADETNVLIIDKIIKISEVTYEKKTVGDDSSNLGNINHSQDIVTESMQDIPQSGGMCSHPSATEGENGGSVELGMVQEAQLGNVSQVTEPCQVRAGRAYLQVPFSCVQMTVSTF